MAVLTMLAVLGLAGAAEPETVEITLDGDFLVTTSGEGEGMAAVRIGYALPLGNERWMLVPALWAGYLTGFPVDALDGTYLIGLGAKATALVWNHRRRGADKDEKGRARFDQTLDLGPYLYLATATLDDLPREGVAQAGVVADFRWKWFIGGAQLGWLHGVDLSDGANAGAASVGLHAGGRW